MEKLFRIIFIGVLLYGLLYWAVNNPKSAASIKNTIDNTAGEIVDKAKDAADNLTDK
jgi:hypothetical protein